MVEGDTTQHLECGDIYFFYRNKINVEKARSLDDIQNTHLVLLPDDTKTARMFIVGKKRLPDAGAENRRSTEKEWLTGYLVDTPEKIGEAMKPQVYETESKGRRVRPEAIPAGAGRYALVERADTTYLTYRLDRPSDTGKVQDELGIQEAAAYVISVRNPDIPAPGFPDDKPDFPKDLRAKFADERWISVGEPRLLDFPKAHFLLVGADDDLGNLGVSIKGSSDLFGKLGLNKSDWPLTSLQKGNFGESLGKLGSSGTIKASLAADSARVASSSAAAVAKVLKGIRFPKQTQELVDYAEGHGAAPDVVELLEAISPQRRFDSLQDVQFAIQPS